MGLGLWLFNPQAAASGVPPWRSHPAYNAGSWQAATTTATPVPTAGLTDDLSLNPEVQIAEQSASPDFPDSIQFRLRARGVRGFEIQRALLNYQLVGEPVTSSVEAEVEGPAIEVDVKLSLDLGTHYIPPGATVAYYWSLVGPSGDVVDTPTDSFVLVDERYEWRELADAQERVITHWYSGSDEFGRLLLATASAALDRLERDIGTGLQRQAHIWVYESQDELASALPKHIPEWVGGKAYPQLALVLAAIPDDHAADSEIRRIIPHELSHLVLYQATRNPYNVPPTWLDEGLATYNQETQDSTDEELLRKAAEEGQLLPLRALSGSFPADEEAARISYVQSRSVVQFILEDERYGRDRLAKTVVAFRQGVTYDEALQAGLGVKVDELDRQWREWLPYEVAESAGTISGTDAGTNTPAEQREDGSEYNPAYNPVAWFFTVMLIVGALLLGIAVLVTVVLIRRRRWVYVPSNPPVPMHPSVEKPVDPRQSSE
jgi:hypothetical protein